MSANVISERQEACLNLSHLRRFTMGNRDLEIEVLGLFVGQAPQTLGLLAAATDAKQWHMAAHTLKGSARAVGAEHIAELAQRAEQLGFAGCDRARTIVELEAAIAQAGAAIEQLTRQHASAA